ncbi:RND transporter [Psychroflexus planctonicus]|uniref:RND transporter n=2 Tax=Psychroflexus planctonicus TaxID=1526575 RepID=A0ABQ1SBX6_9FLAO|nr:RND transporter [Psychroflexus planctonicus]
MLIACGDKENERNIDEILENNNKEEIQQLKEELYAEQRKVTTDLERVNEKLLAFEDKSKYSLVEAEQVEKSNFKHYIKVQGNVTTDENLLIYPEFTGVLTNIYIQEGDRVKKGQLLARIDDGGMQNQLQELRAQRELVKTRFERQERLWDENIGSEIQFLEAKTGFEQIDNSVKQMQQQLAKAEIRAPFDGVVDEVITDRGQVVMQNQNALFRVVNLRNMYIEANVPETYVGKIDKDTESIVNLRALETSFEAKVDRVSSFIEDSNRNFRVRVSVPDSIEYVKPNLIATLQLNDYTNNEAIKVSENVLQETATGEFFVFKLEKQEDNVAKAVYQKVIPGRNYQGKIEILEGLQAGDFIVTEGARTLKRDEKVRIANTNK